MLTKKNNKPKHMEFKGLESVTFVKIALSVYHLLKIF